MNNKLIVSLSAAVLLAASVGFSLTTTRTQKVAPGQGPTTNTRTAVIYGAFFQFVVDLQNQALELEGEGAKGGTLRGYVQTQANLNDYEATKLGAIAAACVAQVTQQDAKALQVIEKFQSQFPGGRIPSGSKLPPPPPELKVLQQGRDQIILAARSSLRSALGDAGFNKVEQFATSRLALSVRPTGATR